MADTSQTEGKIGLLIWKISNFWQSNLRKTLLEYNISVNEYLILLSLNDLLKRKKRIYQDEIAKNIGVNISVTSITLKSLELKRYIIRKTREDNRKKIVTLSNSGNKLYETIHPLVESEEYKIFNKLNNESFNFTNSLKLLLGKKIRIKVEKQK